MPENKTLHHPVLVTGVRQAVWQEAGGEPAKISFAEAAARLATIELEGTPLPIVCHAQATARRLGLPKIAGLDILELFAFTHPAVFCLPTPKGLAVALKRPAPRALIDQAGILSKVAGNLLEELSHADLTRDRDVGGLAAMMTQYGWPWGPCVLDALTQRPGGKSANDDSLLALEVWRRLKEWGDYPLEPAPGNVTVSPDEAQTRLKELLGEKAENRPQQGEYASAVTSAFSPRELEDEPRITLAEAGTGVGKTMGYLAPASLWAQKNNAPVWISTFTRNLQHQIDRELDRIYPDKTRKAAKAVIRKGRENYLCLLNFEEAAKTLPTRAPASRERDAAAIGLLARWVGASRDGDMMGGDFPAWLSDLLGRRRSVGLTDRRGECIYSSCPHFKKCFIERSVRRAHRSEIVIANHALVMIQAAMGGGEDDDPYVPSRYVFDEGHHVFDAADSCFSAHLSGLEMIDLRRWLLGNEGGATKASASRMRGLKRRIGDLTAQDEKATHALEEIIHAAQGLPSDGWLKRLNQQSPFGPGEAFLLCVRQQVYARAHQPGNVYSIETDTLPPVDGLLDAAAKLEKALGDLFRPLVDLSAALTRMLGDKASEMESSERLRLDAMCRGLKRRAETQVEAWQAMLAALRADPQDTSAFIDWFSVERLGGKDCDVGLHRHWIDPTIPFIEYVARPSQGLLITSATLKDQKTRGSTPEKIALEDNDANEPDLGWAAALTRTGAMHLSSPPHLVSVPSPFDYPKKTRVIVVNDVNRENADHVAAAYRELFLAANGGALGLFTAINRLKAVYERICAPMDEKGLPLYAQHVDGLDTSTLIEIFRAEEDSSLLGTDAVRDGVDVPGRSLRLIVFDRVPWPRPNILHRARKAAFGRGYDDMLTRLRLKQAYGRLIRKAGDTGVFVLLDSRLPSRLASAFPQGVEIERIGLAEAVQTTRDFLTHNNSCKV